MQRTVLITLMVVIVLVVAVIFAGLLMGPPAIKTTTLTYTLTLTRTVTERYTVTKMYASFWLLERPLSRNISMTAEGAVIHYQEELEWSETQFSQIVKNEKSFKSLLVEKIRQTYSIEIGNPDVSFDRARRVTVFKCDMKGAKLDETYDFSWFLTPLKLDFIDSHFTRSERKLSWHGLIGGVPTSIVLKFPFKIANCHAHVWPA